MKTIVPDSGQRELSSQGRIEAWTMLTNLALDRPIVGRGFNPYNPQVWSQEPTAYRDAPV
jgi:hypothetical protein